MKANRRCPFFVICNNLFVERKFPKAVTIRPRPPVSRQRRKTGSLAVRKNSASSEAEGLLCKSDAEGFVRVSVFIVRWERHVRAPTGVIFNLLANLKLW